jgi:cation diffusion facilitator family transporter
LPLNKPNFKFNSNQPTNPMPLRTQFWVLMASVLILIIKFVAYFLTQSNAILTDALESIINVVAGAFGVFALYLSQLPKDENHPYGHGKIEFVSAAMEGTLIIVAGGAMILHAGQSLVSGAHTVQQLDWGLVLIFIAAIGNFVLGRILVTRGAQHLSPAMQASGEHLLSDAYMNAGLFTGLLAVFITQVWWLDNLLAIVMGAIIAYTGFNIVKSSMSGIMDETDYALAEAVIDCLQQNRRATWIDIHNLRIIRYGSSLHIDCHITVPFYYTVEQAHEILKEIETTLGKNTDRTMEIFIHTDPCVQDVSCMICAKPDCLQRTKPFMHQLEWRLENVLKNEKHTV